MQQVYFSIRLFVRKEKPNNKMLKWYIPLQCIHMYISSIWLEKDWPYEGGGLSIVLKLQSYLLACTLYSWINAQINQKNNKIRKLLLSVVSHHRNLIFKRPHALENNCDWWKQILQQTSQIKMWIPIGPSQCIYIQFTVLGTLDQSN